MTRPRRRPWQIRAAANGHAVHVPFNPGAYQYVCTCDTTGPPRVTYAEAFEDSQQHLDNLDRPRKDPT